MTVKCLLRNFCYSHDFLLLLFCTQCEIIFLLSIKRDPTFLQNGVHRELLVFNSIMNAEVRRRYKETEGKSNYKRRSKMIQRK